MQSITNVVSDFHTIHEYSVDLYGGGAGGLNFELNSCDLLLHIICVTIIRNSSFYHCQYQTERKWNEEMTRKRCCECCECCERWMTFVCWWSANKWYQLWLECWQLWLIQYWWHQFRTYSQYRAIHWHTNWIAPLLSCFSIARSTGAWNGEWWCCSVLYTDMIFYWIDPPHYWNDAQRFYLFFSLVRFTVYHMGHTQYHLLLLSHQWLCCQWVLFCVHRSFIRPYCSDHHTLLNSVNIFNTILLAHQLPQQEHQETTTTKNRIFFSRFRCS